jgi:hypothetical protein
MGASSRQIWQIRLGYCLVGLLALSGGGCLAVAAGTAIVAGGMAAGAYFTGAVNREYRAGFNETLTATKQSLTSFGMTITKEKVEPNDTAVLESLTGSGQPVFINLHTRVAEIPAQGAITTVEVRVGPLGDRSVPERFGAAGQEAPLSEQLLNQIGGQLSVSPRGAPGAGPTVVPLQPGNAPVQQPGQWSSSSAGVPNAPLPLQTQAPPLAPPPPIPVSSAPATSK